MAELPTVIKVGLSVIWAAKAKGNLYLSFTACLF